MTRLSDLKSIFKAELAELFHQRELIQLFQIVSEEVLGLSRIEQLTEIESVISENKCESFKLVIQRLKDHEPYQYIFQKAEFRGREYGVNENVLIPRPETEELVSAVLECAQPNDHIIDLGTGSGCIAVSLSLESKNANVWALDVSETAIKMAEANAVSHGAQIEFLVSSMDEKLPSDQRFDIIVSNPPYIGIEEKNLLEKNVTRYEPHIALFSKTNDPLYFYKQIELRAQESLKSGGFIFLELHENYAEETKLLFMNSKYTSATLINDLQGKQRILKVEKN